MVLAKHAVNGIDYEIRIEVFVTDWQMQIFRTEKQVGPRFSISFETESDIQGYNMKSATDFLINIAKTELDAGNVK